MSVRPISDLEFTLPVTESAAAKPADEQQSAEDKQSAETLVKTEPVSADPTSMEVELPETAPVKVESMETILSESLSTEHELVETAPKDSLPPALDMMTSSEVAEAMEAMDGGVDGEQEALLHGLKSASLEPAPVSGESAQSLDAPVAASTVSPLPTPSASVDQDPPSSSI
ncbi:hypothetical protein IW146_001061 [Coemansia sp. RSA 922]|nr:hypothetical protein IW146_001061 [Coemansia sp. RSA 922]